MHLREIQAINLYTQCEVYLHMIRVQAYIVGQTGDIYHVETLTEGHDAPRQHKIKAKSEDEAALTALRRAEETEQTLRNAMRLN